MNDGERKEAKPSKGLTLRTRIFLLTLWASDLKRAMAISGYSQPQLWRILRDDRAKEFYMSLFTQTAEKLGITYEEQLQKYEKMADNPHIPGSTRAAIRKDLLDRFEPKADEALRVASFEVIGPKSKLTPAKEYKELPDRGGEEGEEDVKDP